MSANDLFYIDFTNAPYCKIHGEDKIRGMMWYVASCNDTVGDWLKDQDKTSWHERTEPWAYGKVDISEEILLLMKLKFGGDCVHK
jgi:hypothetical protein